MKQVELLRESTEDEIYDGILEEFRIKKKIEDENYIKRWGTLESRTWFISDLHLGDDKLNEGLRKMTSMECWNLIRENWNKTVAPNDIVYVLGDLFGEYVTDEFITQEFLRPGQDASLSGHIKIIIGNHDIKLTERLFNEEVEMASTFSNLKFEIIGGLIIHEGYLCTHIPVHPREFPLFKGNIHGHLHKSGYIEGYGEYIPYEPGDNYFNVNCEHWNYYPVSLKTLIGKADDQEELPSERKILSITTTHRLFELGGNISRFERMESGYVIGYNSNGEPTAGIPSDYIVNIEFEN